MFHLSNGFEEAEIRFTVNFKIWSDASETIPSLVTL